MMMLRSVPVLLTVISCSILFTQCKKTTDSVQPDYSPLTAGSTRTYLSSGSTYTLTATNKDTTVNSHTYRVLTNSAGGNNYLGKSGNDYYRFGTLSGIGINNLEELYLKDNSDVNTTWKIDQSFTYPGVPIPLTATLNYTIKAKGVSHTVNGKNFDNVVQVRLDLSISGFGSVGGGDFYYAAGVGMIESDIAVNAVGVGSFNETTTLTAYQVK